nr:MAG TPA: hypothetical protein [Caudoviricetes sp.]
MANYTKFNHVYCLIGILHNHVSPAIIFCEVV